MEFKNIIIELIKESGLSRVQFAELIGVNQGHLSNWINGVNKPTYEHLYNMCKILDISGDRILGLNEYSE